jgi:ABC-type microcin C transport system permease subunit YejE
MPASGPKFSPQAVFLALFYGFVFRLSSFQQLEPDLAEPSRQRWLGVQEAFGDDVLHYSLCGFHVSSLEGMQVEVNRRLKRNKVLDPGRL